MFSKSKLIKKLAKEMCIEVIDLKLGEPLQYKDLVPSDSEVNEEDVEFKFADDGWFTGDL